MLLYHVLHTVTIFNCLGIGRDAKLYTTKCDNNFIIKGHSNESRLYETDIGINSSLWHWKGADHGIQP